jgi:hypothetical protein
MGSGSTRQTDVHSIAVSATDLVTALETARRTGKDAVLRVTPPFSGRMRARLHVTGSDSYDDPAPIHVDPEALLTEDAPTYPTPAETADELRADPSESYSRERHHERHSAAVDGWRETVLDAVVDTVTIPTQSGGHEVAVTVLGTGPGDRSDAT